MFYGSAGDVLVKIAAIMFILAVVSSASTWLMGSDRSQAIAAIEHTHDVVIAHVARVTLEPFGREAREERVEVAMRLDAKLERLAAPLFELLDGPGRGDPS